MQELWASGIVGGGYGCATCPPWSGYGGGRNLHISNVKSALELTFLPALLCGWMKSGLDYEHRGCRGRFILLGDLKNSGTPKGQSIWRLPPSTLRLCNRN